MGERVSKIESVVCLVVASVACWRGMINSSCFLLLSPALSGRLAPGSIRVQSTAFLATPTGVRSHARLRPLPLPASLHAHTIHTFSFSLLNLYCGISKYRIKCMLLFLACTCILNRPSNKQGTVLLCVV